MKILKRPENTVFDTAKIDNKETTSRSFTNLSPLHQTHTTTDREFLSQFFPDKHPIFDEFGKSYYYAIPD